MQDDIKQPPSEPEASVPVIEPPNAGQPQVAPQPVQSPASQPSPAPTSVAAGQPAAKPLPANHPAQKKPEAAKGPKTEHHFMPIVIAILILVFLAAVAIWGDKDINL